jgi:hypothetical protein
MAGTRAKALAKMQAAYGYWRPLRHAAVADKGQTAHGSDLHLFRGHVWRGRHEAVKDKMSAVVKKALRSILALHPRDCSSDVLYGDTGLPPGYSLMLPNCVGSTDARTWRLADGPEALRFSFEGSRGVGRPKVGTDWCGNVKLPSRSSTPEYCQGDCTGKVNQPCRVAPRRSPASLDAVRSQPEVDTG